MDVLIGWKMVPQKMSTCQSLGPVDVTLYGNKVSADATKLKDHEMGRVSWIIQVGPKSNREGFVRKRQRETGHRGDT